MLRHRLAGGRVPFGAGDVLAAAVGLGLLLVAAAGRKSGPVLVLRVVLVLGVGVGVGVDVSVGVGVSDGEGDGDGSKDVRGSALGNGLVLAVADGLGRALGKASVSGWH